MTVAGDLLREARVEIDDPQVAVEDGGELRAVGRPDEGDVEWRERAAICGREDRGGVAAITIYDHQTIFAGHTLQRRAGLQVGDLFSVG